jgi:hypothetical protein
LYKNLWQAIVVADAQCRHAAAKTDAAKTIKANGTETYQEFCASMTLSGNTTDEKDYLAWGVKAELEPSFKE